MPSEWGSWPTSRTVGAALVFGVIVLFGMGLFGLQGFGTSPVTSYVVLYMVFLIAGVTATLFLRQGGERGPKAAPLAIGTGVSLVLLLVGGVAAIGTGVSLVPLLVSGVAVLVPIVFVALFTWRAVEDARRRDLRRHAEDAPAPRVGR